MSSQESGGSWSTRDIALYIGAPVAAVCVVGGVYYLYSHSGSNDEREEKAEQVNSEVDGENNQYDQKPKTVKELIEEAQSSKLKGNKYFKGEKFDQAIRCYTEAIELCPSDKKEDLATFYQNRAAAHEKLENTEEVINDCTKALDLNKKYTKAYMRRARSLEKVNRKEECLQDLTAVCMLEGFSNPQWMVHADRVLKDIGKEKAKEHFKTREAVLPSVSFIKSYLESFDNDVMLDVEVEKESESGEMESATPFLEAVKQMKEGKYEDIVQLCSKQIEKGESPHLAHTLTLRGTIYLLMSKVDEAIRDFDWVLDMDEDDTSKKLKVNCLVKRGTLKMQQNKTQESFDDFNQAINIDPQNSDIYHHRGQINFLNDKMDEAKEDFGKSIALNDDFIQSKIQLGYCMYKSALTQQSPLLMQSAVQMFEDVVKKYPESPDAISLYAQLLQDQQKFDESLANFEKVIKLQPDNPVNYVYKGLLMVQWKQDIQKAVDLINTALEKDDKCDFAYETMATLEVQRGNTEKAVELFNKAVNFVRTENEMAHAFALCEAAKAQHFVTKTLGIKPPAFPGM